MEGFKKCTKCKEVKELSKHFYKRSEKNKKHLYRSHCIECELKRKREQHRKRYANDEKYRERKRDESYKRKYKSSLSDYEKLLKSQKGLCAICKTSDPGKNRNNFAVDHCHDTGAVRGLLCDRCNRGLGYFLDNAILLLKAAMYLIKSYSESKCINLK